MIRLAGRDYSMVGAIASSTITRAIGGEAAVIGLRWRPAPPARQPRRCSAAFSAALASSQSCKACSALTPNSLMPMRGGD